MIRIFIAEKSAIIRSIEKEIISANSLFSISGDAAGEKEFFERIESIHTDALIIDFSLFTRTIENMLKFLSTLEIPVLMFVSERYINVHAPSGIELTTKPDFDTFNRDKILEYSIVLEKIITRQRSRIRNKNVITQNYNFSSQNISIKSNSYTKKSYKAVCIGVSTGGPGTIHQLLKDIGPNFPLPIFITQHIDSMFDKNLISWLSQNSPLPVHLAENFQVPKKGNVYFAPTDYHLVFDNNLDGKCIMKLNHDAPVNFLRPAVDKMFDSAAKFFGDKCIGVLLTGMGSDGAKGCCNIKAKGGYTIAEDEQSCVVYGMPKAAVDMGGIIESLPLNKIADKLKQLIDYKKD